MNDQVEQIYKYVPAFPVHEECARRLKKNYMRLMRGKIGSQVNGIMIDDVLVEDEHTPYPTIAIRGHYTDAMQAERREA